MLERSRGAEGKLPNLRPQQGNRGRAEQPDFLLQVRQRHDPPGVRRGCFQWHIPAEESQSKCKKNLNGQKRRKTKIYVQRLQGEKVTEKREKINS